MEGAHELKALGVNINEGLDRVMGDEDLYGMMLGMFVDMIENDAPINLNEFDNSDYTELIERVHTLKGTTGNLSIIPLFEGYTKTLELLRDERPQEAKAAYEEMLSVQGEIIDCIKQHIIKE